MKLLFISIFSIFFITFLFANTNHMSRRMHSGNMMPHEAISISGNSNTNLGSAMYSSCKFCHGLKAEKSYANRVPNINRLDEDALIVILSAYKQGQLDTYGFGSIMKMQMKNIPQEKIPELVKYIKNL